MAAPRQMPTGLCPPIERRATLDRRKSITFKGKSFYLDLPQNKHTQVLTKAICRLDGVIEGFLSRDIDYVVTGNKKALEVSDGSLVAGKRGGHYKRQAAENIEPAMSRGKQLLKKAIKNQEHSSVLANAQSWGVCILHVDEILEYLQRSTYSASKAAEGKAATGAGHTVKVGKLKCPFLKIEDQSRKYRPLQRCFSSFPEISFICSDRSPFETARNNNNNTTHKEKDAGDQEDNDDGEMSQRPNAREKSGYCECCQVTYTKLSEHLISEQHRQFSLDTSNYKVIDDIACHITCDLLEYPHGIPVSEGVVGDGLVSVEDAQVSVVKEESKMEEADVRCEEDGALTTVEENHTERNVGVEHMLGVACRLPVKNIATGEQEESIAVTMDDGEPVEDHCQTPPFAGDPNHGVMQCKEPLQETCDTGVASHVNVVTEVSWYTEDTGLTSVYTVQSLVIPPDSQHAQLTMANALATFSPPLILGHLADPQGALVTEHPSEAHDAPVLESPLPGTQMPNTSDAHCSELLVEQTSLLAIGEQHQEVFAETSTVSFCGVQLLDALVQLPAGEKRSEEMTDLQMGSVRVHEQQVLSGDQNEPLLTSSTGLHTQETRALSQDQLNVIPLYEGPRDTLVVTSSCTPLTNHSDREESQLNVTLLTQSLGTHVAKPLADQAGARMQNQSNIIPVHQGLAEMAQSTAPLGNQASAPEQNLLNAIPLYQGPAMAQSATTRPNKACTQEQIQMQSTTDFCRGKRKHSFSSSSPPAKRQPYQYQPLSLPVWVFQQLSDSGLQPAAARGCPDVKKKETGSVVNEGDSSGPYFSPKLLQYEASSEPGWDLGILSQQQCKHQQDAQLDDLRTAQVSLDESWYGKELCSVLAQDHNLGSLSTSQAVTLAHTSYDLCLSGVAS